ncbi:MAG: hypothetical protein ACD_43C00188G0004 [uncultured bacterium]|nr:MAG: hypothetical protein ACD_43C00188G0004 [uncultured bacterium]
MNYLPQSLQKPFQAVLFDLDGTLLDSEDLHYQAFKQALTDFGYDLNSVDQTQYVGSFRKMFEVIAHQFNLSDDLFEQIYQRKVELTTAWPANSVELVEGVISYLEYMKERAVPMGIVTNSESAYVQHVMTQLDLSHYFDHIVHAEHVVNPKPAPDSYRYGLDLLGLAPQSVLAFENTDGGITAAKSAGLAVIAIRGTDRSGLSTYSEADYAIDHFADPLIDELELYGRH